MIDLTNYTIGDNAKTVKVAEFRQRADHVNRHSDDLGSCGRMIEGKYQHVLSEVVAWLEIHKYLTAELFSTSCKRANSFDWSQRETALTRSQVSMDRANKFIASEAKPACHLRLVK